MRGILTVTTTIIVLLLLSSVQSVRCQITNSSSNPAILYNLTQQAYSQVSNLTNPFIIKHINENASFCIKNPELEWDRTFNYSSNLTFLTSCILKTNGDIARRLCTAAEVKFYFFENFIGGVSGSSNYVRPNINCNLTSWVSGCEPGWACSRASSTHEQINLGNITAAMPDRTLECQPCCEGFFCPRGLTCMIPCPLGSYCPLATLNGITGVCEPYDYQLPPGQTNHTCGGADKWADVGSSRNVFCSAGSHCPTNIEHISCSSGHYCRLGVTSQKRCFKLNSCSSDSATQNMDAYGTVLMVALTALLLIFYNCSDQVLSIRERRRAKVREAAARSVEEKARAQERWKSARDAVEKQLFSSVNSRKKIVADSDQELKIFSGTYTVLVESDGILHDPAMGESTSTTSSTTSLGEKKKKPSDLMNNKKKHDNIIEADRPEVLGDIKKTKQYKSPKRKLHTYTEILNYAYSQLEIEKDLQQQQKKDITFSGIVGKVMNINPETRKRPAIEVFFRDLTITLKGKNKHLLRCVTGKIMPGRVTAVMGPSGAGKTTFLSAVTGKTVGCTMTGSVLINGKAEPICSYKKIIGFVPQDDIVHGNLTVEENLWFSARCRLSAELLEPDKVLIVERTIESLGLQAVRDSLVGTVEKRGISGGQRKRVNVGLELVMEPSLLILDEPTSGLDSSSSQLLLRALRREALEGVNICMVIHQPSYTLFKMFDDLIILAKGGLTAYHGPVNEVEEYFAGLGINIPERVNPPDYIIDVLEGIVKLNSSTDVTHGQLPTRWMLHKGYPVPPDMQLNCAGLAVPSAGVNLGDDINDSGAENGEQSFVEEVWQDMRSNVELQRDIVRRNVLRAKDLSGRKTPNVFVQYRYFLGRVGKQRLREAGIQAIDYLILLVGGACLVSITKVSDTGFGAAAYTFAIIAVSLLCTIAALRSFSLDKLQYWRESASGISSLAHFLAKDTIDHFNTAIKPLVYLSMFYFIGNPRSSFADNYVVLWCLVYCVTGIGYALAIFLEPGPSQLCAVILPVVLTLLATKAGESAILKNLSYLCYPKWALEAFVIANAESYYGVWLITRCGTLQLLGYNIRHWGLCLSILISYGVISRVLAFIGLLTLRKK